MKARHRSSLGLTLIELVVTVTIIGILVALLLPAVQSAREAARRARCANNLKQLGIAISSYAASTGIMPSGAGSFSTHVMLLPYMEQGPLYSAMNFSSDSDAIPGSPNLTTVGTRIAGFLCASDSPRVDLIAGTNYAANWGVGFTRFGAKSNGPLARGDTPIGFAQVSDGTSSTAAMAEWRLGVPPPARAPIDSVFQTPESMVGEEDLDRFAGVCASIDARIATLNGPAKGENWARLGHGYSHYNHNLNPNKSTCTNGTLVPQGAWTAGSRHPSGANVLFVDGHVTFCQESTSVSVWRALGTMNGGEVVSDSL